MMHVLVLIGESLRAAFFMFWETLWALVLGFGLSGAVQAFVSRSEMQRALGDQKPASLTRATFFGMISSSCSYAASAMAKSLFQKGANFTAAIDPVCGMQVQKATAPATAQHAGHTYYFCSDRCHDRFVAAPEHFSRPGAQPEGMADDMPTAATARDPVCGMSLSPAEAQRTHEGRTYVFCSRDCAATFDVAPQRYATSSGAAATTGPQG